MALAPLEGRRLWFVGIGGAGMSALALVAQEWGAEVGGSDRTRRRTSTALEAVGIPVAIGHDAANVPDGAEVIVSSAIAADNPELTRARDTGRDARARAAGRARRAAALDRRRGRARQDDDARR